MDSPGRLYTTLHHDVILRTFSDRLLVVIAAMQNLEEIASCPGVDAPYGLDVSASYIHAGD